MLERLLVVVGLVVLVVVVVIAVGNLDTLEHLGHVSGSLSELALRASEGTLYPPLYDGELYGGTRAMPVPILLHAALIHLSGSAAEAGKTLSLAIAAALALLLWVSISAVGVPIRLGLLGALVAAHPFWMNLLDIRYDGLSIVLQLVALLVVDRYLESRPRLAIAIAAALCALAVFCKLSGVWGAIAILAWLVLNDRRKLALYVGVGAATTVILAIAFNAASSGRFLENILELGLAGVDSGQRGPLGWFGDLLSGGRRAVGFLVRSSPAVLVIVPFGLLSTGRWRPPIRVGIYRIAFLACLASTLMVFADVGAWDNHLLAPIVLLLLVVGRAFAISQPSDDGGAAPGPESRRLLLAALFLATIVGALHRGVRTELAMLRTRDGPAAERTTKRGALLALTDGKSSILSEDPWVCIVRGERPIVLDAFMLLRLDQLRPDLVDPLIRRIERQEFDGIVLSVPIDSFSRTNFYARIHLGVRVSAAIEAAYRPSGAVSGTSRILYVPKPE